MSDETTRRASSGSESVQPRATVVVTQRERYGHTRRSLESLYGSTTAPFELVYVDTGSPPHIQAYLEQQSRVRPDFKLLRHDSYLGQNEARNVGFREVNTEYVVFIDNDVVMEQGWLEGLLSCADESGATIVGPLYMIGEPGHAVVHMAGGDFHVVERNGRKAFSEKPRYANVALSEVAGKLTREQVDFVDLHCTLVRAEALREMDGFDEKMLTIRQHLDLCLEATRRGFQVVLEPSVKATFVPPSALEPTDRRFFRRRWDRDRNLATLHHFCAKWGYDNDEEALSWIRYYRWKASWPRLWKIAHLIRSPSR